MQIQPLLTRQNFAKALTLAGGALLLLLTWCLAWVWCMAMTEGWLAPWDTAPVRPPLGTWTRAINDYFETSPGAYLPATLFVGANALWLAVCLRRATNKSWLLFVFAITNFIFVIVATFGAILAHQLPDLWLPQPRPLFDFGFHRTWPAIVTTVAWVLVLFRLQGRWSFNFANKK